MTENVADCQRWSEQVQTLGERVIAAEADAALAKRRVDGLRKELRTGEELMHRITGQAMLATPPIEFNDLELANRWRMRVKLLFETAKLVLAAPPPPAGGSGEQS